MYSVLFVLSEMGYWGEECAVPFRRLAEEGCSITVTTPTGSRPQIDENSLLEESTGEERIELSKRVDGDDRMKEPIPFAQVDPNEYDAVVFPGGHGPLWDVNIDAHAHEILRTAVKGSDGVASVICHTTGILGFARDSSGDFLVEGRDVTGFPNAWEEDVLNENEVEPHGRKLPYWAEDVIIEAGGIYDAQLDSESSVRVDGDLITVRGPDSSEEGVETLLEKLDS